MSFTSILKPANPTILEIARKYETKNTSLLNTMDLAFKGDEKTKRILEENEILIEGFREVREEAGIYESEPNINFPYWGYLQAVGIAQRRIKREGSELNYLKILIKKIYPKDKWLSIFTTLSEISETLGDCNDETNFLNYLIDTLINVLLAKKMAIIEGAPPRLGALLELENVDSELKNGDWGFALDPGFESHQKVVDLLILGAEISK